MELEDDTEILGWIGGETTKWKIWSQRLQKANTHIFNIVKKFYPPAETKDVRVEDSH